mgnify:CR=1 FL=1
MKPRRRMLLVIATLLLLASIVMPLFAGYCQPCFSSLPCNIIDPACVERTELSPTSSCAVCQVEEGDLVYFACTDCLFRRFLCEKRVAPPYASSSSEEWVQCSAPPYRLIVQEENNHRRLDRPYTCVWTGERYLCQ